MMMFPFPSNSRLHKRRDKLQQRGRDARVQRDAREVAVRDDLRLGACGVKIRHDVLDTRAVIEIHRVLKVQVQTAVIEVDRADDGLAVVADEHLRVHEAGRILIDLHPGVEQLAVVSLGEGEGELLVRHVRQNELHVHAALGRERERHDHRLVEDEVRRCAHNARRG